MRILSSAALVVLALSASGAEKPDPRGEFEARQKKLKEKDAKGWLALADFCELKALWEERGQCLGKAVDADPGSAEARARRDEALFEGQWLPADEADAKVLEAQRAKGMAWYGAKWVPEKEAAKLLATDRKRIGWDFEHRIDTEHLRIHSNRDFLKTRRLAAMLENEVRAYERFCAGVLKLHPLAAPIPVYVIEDRATLERVGTSARGGNPVPPDVGGFWCGKAGILFVGIGADGLVDEGNFVHVALHELIHGLDNLMAKFANTQDPIWLFEGWAEHWAYSVEGRQVLLGKGVLAGRPDRHPQQLEAAVDAASIPELVRMTQGEFMSAGGTAYPQSWGLVHFLLHGEGGKHAEGFRAYLKQVQAQPAKASLEAALGVKLRDLGEPYRKHVKEVLLPSVKRLE